MEMIDACDPRGEAPPLGARYDVGAGRRFMLHQAGTGAPAVVIEAGAGTFGLDYPNIPERCAHRTTCVLYDRAGSGWSDPATGSRTTRGIVSDLREALRQAGIVGPQVLVGHSFGGLLVRAFAQTFPQDVVELVLIDPLVEGIPLPEAGDEAAADAMIEEPRRNPGVIRERYPQLDAEWEKRPSQVSEPPIARHLDPEHAGQRSRPGRPAAATTVSPTAPGCPRRRSRS